MSLIQSVHCSKERIIFKTDSKPPFRLPQNRQVRYGGKMTNLNSLIRDKFWVESIFGSLAKKLKFVYKV